MLIYWDTAIENGKKANEYHFKPILHCIKLLGNCLPNFEPLGVSSKRKGSHNRFKKIKNYKFHNLSELVREIYDITCVSLFFLLLSSACFLSFSHLDWYLCSSKSKTGVAVLLKWKFQIQGSLFLCQSTPWARIWRHGIWEV